MDILCWIVLIGCCALLGAEPLLRAHHSAQARDLFKVEKPSGEIAIVSQEEFAAHYEEYHVLERLAGQG